LIFGPDFRLEGPITGSPSILENQGRPGSRAEKMLPCEEMFEGWTSISLAWQLPLSVGWRMWKFASCPFCICSHIILTYIATSIYLNSYAQKPHLAKWVWRGHAMESLKIFDNWICHEKLIEAQPSNISWNLLVDKIFSSPISVGTYHGQHFATSVLWDANQFSS